MYIPIVTDIFAYIMKFIMSMITTNFGLAIIIFTVITKLLMFPLQLKSKKGVMDQQRIAPKMAALEKKYKNNKQKYSEEVQKLYKEEGVSMLGGCLPSILMIVMVFGLYGVVYRPVTYLMNQKSEQVTEIAQVLVQSYDEQTYVDVTGKGTVWIETLRNQLETGKLNELNVAQALEGNTEALSTAYPGVFGIDFMFLGLDLGDMPTYNPINLLIILPILSALTAYGMSWVSQKYNAVPNTGNEAAASAAKSAKTMMYFMPLMSLVFGFTLPAGVTVYWILNNILSAAQEPLLIYVAKKKYGKELPAVAAKKAPVVTTGEVKAESAPAGSGDEGESKDE